MKLDALMRGIPVLEKIHWDPHRSFGKITSDSRSVEPGDIFVACPGSRMDGHDFLGQAILAKASVIIFRDLPDLTLPRRVTAIRVSHPQACLAELLKRIYDFPDRDVKLIGVTGTNGKTTIAYLLHRLLREKVKTAYIGTLWYELPSQKIMAPNTTPGPEVLYPLLDEMRQNEVQYCILEVSSHALEQCRVHGLQFELAVFSQLTPDHLDYHGSMEKYFGAKRRLFSGEPKPHQMLINRDCPYGRRLLEEHQGAKSYGLGENADYRADNAEYSLQGSRFHLKHGVRDIPFQIRLPMKHNMSNLLAVLGSLDLLGFDLEDFRGFLQEMPGIPGRLERVSGTEDFQVFVDYAHTADAVENVLREAKQLNPKRILTLIGCGGDRDRTKRPLMAEAACRYSDTVILTSDNPRSEDPEFILEEMKKGVPAEKKDKVLEVIDRREAIEKLISLAQSEDVVFVLGKGHEDYQILGEKKIPFDDRLVVQDCLKRKSRVFFS